MKPTKKTDETEIDENGFLAILGIASNHQNKNQEDGDAKVGLKLPSRDQGPDLVGSELGVAMTGT